MPLGNQEWQNRLLLQLAYTKHFISIIWVDLRFQMKNTHPHLQWSTQKSSPPTKMQLPHPFFSTVSADHIYDHCKSQKGLCWVAHWLITCVTNYQLKNQISALLQADFFFHFAFLKKCNSLLGTAKTLFFFFFKHHNKFQASNFPMHHQRVLHFQY